MATNALEYLIKLKADGGNVSSTARQINGELNTIEKNADKVGSSLREAFSFSNFKSSLMSIPGMQFLMNPYTIIGAGIGAVTKLGAEAEMTSVSFNKLVGDEQKAADTLAQIKEFANNTPYETMDLVDSAKQMLSFGVSTEQTVNMMKRLGDIAMGDKNRMSSLALVYSQVASQGKMMGQDFLQFVNAGFNPIQELAQMTGKTTAELKDMMSKGEIGETAVAAAIEHATNAGGKFAGMSEALADTTEGKLSTLMGKISETAASAYTAIQPLVNCLLDLAMWVTDNIDVVSALAVGIGAFAVAANAASISVALVSGATKAWAAVQVVMNALLTANPIGLVIAGIAALVAAIAVCWNKFAGFRAFLITTWDVIKQVGNAIKQLFSGDIAGAFNTVKDAFSSFGAKFDANLATERKKQSAAESKSGKTNKIGSPGLAGSGGGNLFQTGASGTKKKGKGVNSKDASEIATGGTRNTQITMSIGKFFDNLQVTMADRTDTAELETIVVQSLNRALAIATSTDR